MSATVLQGDCIETMANLPEGSVDAVVCDPPYGIGFMGHEWDQPGSEHGPVGPGRAEVQGGRRRVSQPNTTVSFGGDPHPAMEAGRYDLSLTANQRFQRWCQVWATQALRVLKPGGHMLVFGGTRTHHRLVAGVEDAGFEIRDRILDLGGNLVVHCPDGELDWLFGSGFPKSLDVAKAIDTLGRSLARRWFLAPHGTEAADETRTRLEEEAPDLDCVEEWQGWGTALKPAHEPIVVARKPLLGTVAANVLEHGTGGLNIAACRISTDDDLNGGTYTGARRETGAYALKDGDAGALSRLNRNGIGEFEQPAGRFPANVVLSHTEDCNGECAPGCPVVELDTQSGMLKSGFMAAGTEREGIGYQGGLGNRVRNDTHGDSGGASRFFYQAKCSRSERNAGLEGFDAKALNWSNGEQSPGTFQGEGTDRTAANSHPTVKPINLMRWLARLVTPPGGLILDPFLGSGSTGCAAVLEGFDFIGIEREPEYIAIAEARIAFWAQHEGRETKDVLKAHKKRKAPDPTQPELLEAA